MSALVLSQGPATAQTDLFGVPASATGPKGFRYQPDLITADEEAEIANELSRLPFEPFDFHGHLAHRHVIGFGYRYDYSSRTVLTAAPIPAFMQPLRRKIGAFTGLAPEAFEQVLINQYRPGAGIGWHRDKPSQCGGGHPLGAASAIGTADARVQDVRLSVAQLTNVALPLFTVSL